jgi:hypothetical protein
MPGVFGRFLEVFGPFFLAEQTVTAMTYLNVLQLYLLPQLEDHQPDVVSSKMMLVMPGNFLTCIFLDAGLGVMDQFRGHRARITFSWTLVWA